MIRLRFLSLVIAICAAASIASFAQKRNANAINFQSGAWVNNILEYKHELLLKEIDITNEADKEAFLELYTAMERELYTANKEVRDIESRLAKAKNVTDAEYLKAAETMSEIKMKEANIEAEYFAKFSKLLTKKQLFLMKSAEIKFSRSVMRQGRQKK